MRVAILTISDSVSRGTSKDASGSAVRDRCAQRAWTVTAEEVFPDDLTAIRDRLLSLAGSGSVDLILTTGGTGIGPGRHSRSHNPGLRKAVTRAFGIDA